MNNINEEGGKTPTDCGNDIAADQNQETEIN